MVPTGRVADLLVAQELCPRAVGRVAEAVGQITFVIPAARRLPLVFAEER